LQLTREVAIGPTTSRKRNRLLAAAFPSPIAAAPSSCSRAADHGGGAAHNRRGFLLSAPKTPLPLDERLERAGQLVVRARKFYDVWAALRDATRRPAAYDLMDAHFSEFFEFTIHAHFVAFVVHMAALFERKDTINLRRLTDEMKAENMPSQAAAEVDALFGEANPLATKVAILRNNVFAHRSAFDRYAEVFSTADVTEAQLLRLTEIALDIVDQLLRARSLPDQSFNPAAREQAKTLIETLLRDHARANH
jgi:HEPN superfamily AbiU2-like protein